MSESEQRWIPMREALAKLRSAPPPIAEDRLAGWIIDQRVGLRAREVVAFLLPESKPHVWPESTQTSDDNAVYNIPPSVPFEPTRKVVTGPHLISDEDIGLMHARGAFDPRAAWWQTGELSLLLDSWGQRRTFYGIDADEGALLRCMWVAGLGETVLKPVQTGRAPAQEECAERLRAVLPSAPAGKTKSDFAAELSAAIPGLSQRAFDRAWATVAPPFGRSSPGAKRKSPR